jgi:hypothetical protein
MSNLKGNVVRYNALIATVKISSHELNPPIEVNLADREIACQHCRSIFNLSEGKSWIRSVSKQKLDAA